MQRLMLGRPKTDILEAGRVTRVWLECRYFTRGELRDKTRVCGPEKSNVWDRVEDHGYSLQTKSKGPSYFFRHVYFRDSGNQSKGRQRRRNTNLRYLAFPV